MVGRVPIPPYIRKGVMSKDDVRDYQTVYAASPGAVAAPTAGLHFDEKSLQKIADSKVLFCPVTLHVGIGTFRPISVEKLDEHIMHKEFASIEKKVVERITNARNAGGRIFALGTTSVRTLESASIASGTLAPFAGETDLFIKPPYNFRSVDLLFTNFHFPKSTLYILVRTFGGDELIERAYREAIEKKYRFFSYGDAMLII